MTKPELTTVMSSPAEGGDDVSDALLAAGRSQVERVGIRRLRMDDVAKEAGYGRATLYRRFATRDELVRAVVSAEIDRTLHEIEAEVVRIADLRERMVEAFAVTVERVRGNALMRRLMTIEPDLLLPQITVAGSAGLDVARMLVASLIREGTARGELHGLDVDGTSEVIVRVAHSLVITPGGFVDSDDPVALRRFARTFIADAVYRLSTPPS